MMAADSPPKKIKTTSDWLNKPYSESSYTAAAKRRAELWEALNAFVIQQGGWITSLPNIPRIRIEMRQGSDLVSKLIAAGFNPTHCGTNTRNTMHGFTPVDVVEILLSGK